MIDLAAFGTDSVITDITRFLGSSAGNNWELWEEALAAYHAIRPLSQQERCLIEVFDSSNLLLSALGCFERYCATFSDPENSTAHLLSRLSERLKEYLNRLETYCR